MTRRAYSSLRVIRRQRRASLKFARKGQIYSHPQTTSSTVKQFHYDKRKAHAKRELKRIAGCRKNQDFRKYIFFLSNMTYVRNT